MNNRQGDPTERDSGRMHDEFCENIDKLLPDDHAVIAVVKISDDVRCIMQHMRGRFSMHDLAEILGSIVGAAKHAFDSQLKAIEASPSEKLFYLSNLLRRRSRLAIGSPSPSRLCESTSRAPPYSGGGDGDKYIQRRRRAALDPFGRGRIA